MEQQLKKQQIIGLIVAAGVLASTSIALASYPGQKLAGQAARTAHGTVVAQELEPENGGSGLRYTFEVKTATGIHEVGIDAQTGAVLENSIDGEPNESVDGGSVPSLFGTVAPATSLMAPIEQVREAKPSLVKERAPNTRYFPRYRSAFASATLRWISF